MKARGHSYPLAGPSTEQSIMMHYLDLAIIKPDSGLNGKFEQLLVMAIIIITIMVTLTAWLHAAAAWRLFTI